MEPRPGFANEGSRDPVPDAPPFGGAGLLTRVVPFTLVAAAAEASLALPPGTRAWPAVTVSLVLLAATGLAFLLPWNRLPGWATVVVPSSRWSSRPMRPGWPGTCRCAPDAGGPTASCGAEPATLRRRP